MPALGITDDCYECLRTLSPGNTLSTALKILQDPTIPSGSHIEVLAKFLESNQAYVHLLQKIGNISRLNNDWAGMEQEEPDDLQRSQDIRNGLKRSLRLLGPTAAGHAVICLASQINLRQGIPKKEGDSFVLDVEARLRYSLAIKDLWEENNWSLPYPAFLGGLHFDWVNAYFEKQRKFNTQIKNYFNSVWNASLKSARCAQVIGSFLPDFNYQSTVVPAALLLGVGRLLMAINFEKKSGDSPWILFEKEISQPNPDGTSVSLIQRVVEEQKRFSVTHNELASMATIFSGLFTPIARAILHAPEPYLLKGTSSDLYSLSVILSVSQEVTTQNPEEIRGLHPASSRRLAEFGIREDEVIRQIRKAMQK